MTLEKLFSYVMTLMFGTDSDKAEYRDYFINTANTCISTGRELVIIYKQVGDSHIIKQEGNEQDEKDAVSSPRVSHGSQHVCLREQRIDSGRNG